MEIVAVAICAGALFVSVFAVVPAGFGVRLLTRGRTVAPLVRGTIEQSCAVGAALVTSAAALAWIWQLGRSGWLLVVVHPILAAGPWMTGEILSGPSHRSSVSLIAAVG